MAAARASEAMLVVEFAAGTTVLREAAVTPKLPIVQNGPPGTFVRFADGRRVSLPTDQIVFAEDGVEDGAEGVRGARVGFGGMRFRAVEDGVFVFDRVRDLRPAETLSPQRGVRMTLDAHMVAALYEWGRRVWPASAPTVH